MQRRDFLRTGAIVAAGTVGMPSIIPASALGRGGRPAPSDRITMAQVGTGNQGTNDLMAFLNDERLQIVAVCDVNRASAGYWGGRHAGREPARDIVEWTYAVDKRAGRYAGCEAYEDYRDVLARDDIDTIAHALPDHWHGIVTVDAARAGKDVYGQKPLSLTIADGREMSDAVQGAGIIFQCGSQQRSEAGFRRVCELVRNGRIGDLERVEVGLPGGTTDYGLTGHRKAPEPVPDGFNYDVWLGPAPDAPYSPARCHVNFRWILDYSGGQITDWGGHHLDIAQWGMDTEYTGPVEIRKAGGVFSADAPWNTATAYYFECLYRSGVTLATSHELQSGVKFLGTEGWLWVNRGSHRASSDAILNSEIREDEINLYRSADHYRNFVDCVISREQPVAPIEVAHRSISIAHLGNIALRLNRDLKWDPDVERFLEDEEANGMLSRPKRKSWG